MGLCFFIRSFLGDMGCICVSIVRLFLGRFYFVFYCVEEVLG